MKVLYFCSTPPKVKVVTGGLHSGKNVTAQETSLKTFIGTEKSRRVAASMVRSSEELERVQVFLEFLRERVVKLSRVA